MMLPANCGECTPFAEQALHAYQSLLTRYGFEPGECAAAQGGRECALVYRNATASLLFVLSDGAEATAIGASDAPFPATHWSGMDGDGGWYSVIGLIEYVAKKKLLTPRLMDEFLRGQRNYFDWESALSNEWIERLTGLFAPDAATTWQTDFANYARTRRYG